MILGFVQCECVTQDESELSRLRTLEVNKWFRKLFWVWVYNFILPTKLSTIPQVHFELLGRRDNMEEPEELIGASSQRVRNKPRLHEEGNSPHLIAIETNTWCCGTGQDRRHAYPLSAPLVLLHIRDRETADGRGMRIALKEPVLAGNTYKDARPTNHSVSV